MGHIKIPTIFPISVVAERLTKACEDFLWLFDICLDCSKAMPSEETLAPDRSILLGGMQ